MILNRYLYGEILRPLAMGLLILVLIYLGYSVTLNLGDAASGQIDASTIGQLTALSTITVLEVLLPSALYLSVVAAISRLYRDSEMAALRSSGVGEGRVLFAVFKLAVVVALMVAIVSAFARPWAYRESYQLEARSTASYRLENMEPGQFVPIQGGRYMLFAAEVDRINNRLGKVFVQSERIGESQVIYAETARLPDLDSARSPTIRFMNGYAYQLDHRGNRDLTLRFGQLDIKPNLEKSGAAYRRKAEPTVQLAKSTRRKDVAEYQWRLSTPLATILLALLAVPVARSRPRHGRFANFFLAVVIYIALFNLVSVFRTWVEDGRIPTMPGLWAAYLAPAIILIFSMIWPRLRWYWRRRAQA